MQYKLNDLLEDADVAELTAETFAAPKKDTRIWRRVGVLAACAVLMVGLANAGALAAGIRQVWSYITGVGAVAGESEVWVQAGSAETTEDGLVYRVRDAYRQDGYIYLTVDVLFQNDPRENGGDYPWMTLGASLSCGAENRPCQASYFGLPSKYVQERYNASMRPDSAEDLTALGERMGYGDVAARLDGAAAMGSFGVSFKDEGTPTPDYKLSLWVHLRDKTEFYDRPPEASLNLTLEPGTVSPVETYTMDTPYGVLSLLVSENGEKVQLLMERDVENPVQASYVAPLNLCFVDADGKRYAGVPVQMNSGDMRQSEEVRLDGTPSAPIAAIELPGYYLALEDTTRSALDGERYTDYRVENLNWSISLK